MGCLLCLAEKKTHWYHEDDICWVADCASCSHPMIVLRRHSMTATLDELYHMLTVVRNLFGVGVQLRLNQRQVSDHLHWHVEGGS